MVSASTSRNFISEVPWVASPEFKSSKLILTFPHSWTMIASDSRA
jgi:hypothetical protein